jgi:protein-disulfide isomerase
MEAILDIQQTIDPAAIKEAVMKYDKRLEQNKSIRQPLEREWTDYISMAIKGEEGSRVMKLAKQYVNLSNSFYPSSLRQTSAYRLQWLTKDGDWFDLSPSGQHNTNTTLVSAVKSKMRKALNHPESGFYNAIDNFDLQCSLLNTSGLAYSYIMKTEKKRAKTIEIEGGKIRIKRNDGENELVYQGAKATVINMFNCYPDMLSPVNNDINAVDLYFWEAVSLNDLKANPDFDPAAPYAYQDFVIYRDNSELNKLEQSTLTKTDSQRRIEQATQPGIRQNEEGYKGFCELRTAYLKEFCVKNNGTKETYENVIVLYAKVLNEVIPLLVEYNHNPYNRKNILLCEAQTNPWGMYGKSQLGLSYNQACWLNYLRACQAYSVGKTTFRTRFIPSNLYTAAMETGIAKHDLENALRGAGYDIPFNSESYSQGADGIWSPDDKYQMNDIQLMDGEIQKTINQLQEINVDLSSDSAASGTATGVNFVQQKQTAVYKKYLRNMSQSVLQPFLEMFLEDLLLLIRDELIEVDIDDERLEELNPDIEHLVDIFKSLNQNLTQQQEVGTDPNGLPVVMGSEINPVAKKEYITLTQRLLEAFKADIEIRVEGNVYDIEERKRANLELLNFIQQTFANQPEGLKMGAIAMEEYLDLNENENKAKYMEIIESLAQGQEQKQAIEAQAAQDNAKMADAKAQKDMAQTQVMSANAAKTTQEVQDNEQAKQLLGV